MTPTPEDIALADSIARIIAIHRENGEAIFDLDISRRLPDLPAAWKAAYLIAAHTAPLRERIKELEQLNSPSGPSRRS